MKDPQLESETIDFNYDAPGPIAAAFIRDLHPFTFISGPVGSGKSVAILMKAFTRGLVQPPDKMTGKRRTRWCVIRNTRQQLKDTTIVTAREWFSPLSPDGWVESEYTYKLRFGEIEMDFLFRPLDTQDDVTRVLSLEVTGIIINECREVPITLLSDLFGRCGRFPPKKSSPVVSKLVFGDTNAPFEGSDWHHAFAGHPIKALNDEVFDGHFYKQPSGMSPQAENIHNLPEGYYKDFIKYNTKAWVRQYVHNQYGKDLEHRLIFADAYDEFGHVPDDDLTPELYLPVVLGLDLGLTPSIAFVQPNPYTGTIDVIDELCGEGIGLVRFFKRDVIPLLVSRFATCPVIIAPDPAGKIRDQNFETKAVDLLRNLFEFAVFYEYTNDPSQRIELMLQYLERKDYIRISKRCIKLRTALQNVRYPGAKKATALIKKVTKAAFQKDDYSHIVEAFGYALQLISSGVNIKDMADGFVNPDADEIFSQQYSPMFDEGPGHSEISGDLYTGY